METDSVRAVLLDFGGVLSEEGFRDGLHAIAREHGFDQVAFHQAASEAVYATGYVVGQGTEKNFWRLLREKTGLQGDEDDMRQAILSRFVLRPRMLALVRALRHEGYITAILSDQSDWLDWLDSQLHFFQWFDKIYNSYHVGKGKRDPSIFDDVVGDLRLLPRRVVFVDDDQNNVERARSRGLQTVLFQNEDQCVNDLKMMIGHPILEE